MKTYLETLKFLYGLQKRGMKFGLRGIEQLAAALGNPQKRFPAIHVAGSNGKGSTSAMIAAILQSAGYKTGLYTSPHLLDYTERIRIDGVPIAPREVIESAKGLRRVVQRSGATFFETTTAIAFKHFAEHQVDVAVVETGLGGRLDSTNIVDPMVTVITTISREHTDVLGRTLSNIAFEKAGIIKRGVPCVTGVQSKTGLEVIRDRCRRLRAPIVVLDVVESGTGVSTIESSCIDLRVNGTEYRQLKVSLAGRFQIRNAALAALTVQELRRVSTLTLNDSHVRKGLGRIQELTGLNARLSILQRNPLIIADVAHNPEGTERLVESLRSVNMDGFTLVFGVMRDKNVKAMSRELLKVVDRIVLVEPRTDRARPASELVSFFRQRRRNPIVAGTVAEGIEAAKAVRGKQRRILITGSHFVVGEAVAHLQGRKYLTIGQ